jgi:hypothetical protein
VDYVLTQGPKKGRDAHGKGSFPLQFNGTGSRKIKRGLARSGGLCYPHSRNHKKLSPVFLKERWSRKKSKIRRQSKKLQMQGAQI